MIYMYAYIYTRYKVYHKLTLQPTTRNPKGLSLTTKLTNK